MNPTINKDEEYSFVFNVGVFGAAKVGKSTLIEQFVKRSNNNNNNNNKRDSNSNSNSTIIKVSDAKIKLVLEKYSLLASPRDYERRSLILILLVYDVTSHVLFSEIRNRFKQIVPHFVQGCEIVLVRNKVDLQAAPLEIAQQFARDQDLERFETSEKQPEKVVELFDKSCSAILERMFEGELDWQQYTTELAISEYKTLKLKFQQQQHTQIDQNNINNNNNNDNNDNNAEANQIFSFLFEHRATNRNLANFNGTTPLHFVCKNRGPEARQLLNTFLNGEDVNIHATDIFKQSTLHHASIGGDSSIVQSLFERGVRIDKLDIDQRNALIYAITHDRTGVIEILQNRDFTSRY